MSVLRLLVSSSPRMAALATIAGVASGVAHTGLLALINHVIANPGRTGGALALWFAVLAVLKLLTQGWSQVLLNRFAQHAIATLRRDLGRRILGAPLRRLEEVGTPRLLASLTDDVLMIADAYRALPRMAVNVAIVLSCSIYLAWLSPLVLVGVGVFGLAGILTYKVLLRGALKSLARAREIQDSLFGHFHGLTQGVKELKLHAGRRKAFLAEGLDRATDDFEKENRDASLGLALTFGWSQLIYFALIGLLMFLLPAMRDTDARTLTGYVVTTLYLMGPLTIVIDTIPSISAADNSLRKIRALDLTLEQAAENPGKGEPTPDRVGRIAVENAVFRYRGDDHDFTLGPVSLELRGGEITFVVGGNGSGKSTLSKVMTGLYAPDSGRIVVDGKVVDDASREWYRQHFSTVFADFHLFERFIGLDARELDRRAADYLKRLELSTKVKVEGGRLSTTALSQGQRKRLALLTAWLEDRPVYVFDEWAADQDPEFKDVFYKTLLPELRAAGKAVVVITHDDRYFALADRLVRLEGGRIAESRPIAAGSGVPS